MKRLLSTIAVLALLWAVPVGAEVVSRIAAVVNEEVITTRQLDLELAARMATEARGETLSSAAVEARRQTVLSELIEQVLIRQRVAELGIEVSDGEVDEAVDDILKQNNLSGEQLEEALRLQGMSFAEYRKNLRKQIERYKLIGREVQAKVEVTNQEIRAYFREHIDEFREAPFLRLNRMTFALPPRASGEQVEALRAEAEKAAARLSAGEDLYTVLLGYASDPGVDGGDMGTFVEGELTAAFERAVEGLGEGDVSPVVEAAEGFHLLQVAERSPGSIRPYDSVEDEITAVLKERKTQERLQAWSEELKKGAYIDRRL
ncbi:MAG: hypothetical protein C0617_09330 [Desulfuromonas sp.]|uniref:SurA N-terminal domain-containing protein n=1 Tax=Desulfuromonas sp. TaxID=892 RepID=UPI000CAABB80|nr:SurA N-terminal domain-containing protein [Desulfuromonas sp.]PLX84018.1 MAG: hypothetical protein C0617_09330 [Desulfuromonas sp.]